MRNNKSCKQTENNTIGKISHSLSVITYIGKRLNFSFKRLSPINSTYEFLGQYLLHNKRQLPQHNKGHI